MIFVWFIRTTRDREYSLKPQCVCQREGKEPMGDSEHLRCIASQRKFHAPSPAGPLPKNLSGTDNPDANHSSLNSFEGRRTGDRHSVHSSVKSTTSAVPASSVISYGSQGSVDSTDEPHTRRPKGLPDSPAHAAAIEGYLVKRGRRNTRSWKKRWFEAYPGDDGLIKAS